MLFTPLAGDAVCRRVAPSPAPHGTTNMEPRFALDGASWLWHPDLSAGTPGFALFRLPVISARGETVRIQVTADLCYALALDGELVARGPDTGDLTHWAFAEYELRLSRGRHRLEALVWWADAPQAPEGRMTARGVFACAGLGAAGPRFTTGPAPWRVAKLAGVTWGPKLNRSYHVIGCSTQVDLAKFDLRQSRFVRGVEVRAPISFNPCGIVAKGWRLRPSALPEQRHDWWSGGRVRGFLPKWTAGAEVRFEQEASAAAAPGWTELLAGRKPLKLAAREQVTVLIDTDDYLCGFPAFEFRGGAGTTMSWEWAESLFDRIDPSLDNTPGPKGNRGAVAGKTFKGFGDTWRLGGAGRRWTSTPWWRSGRYLLIRIRVGSQPLELLRLGVERTGFPLESTARFAADDPTIAPIVELSERGLRSCMHDLYVDCPYYEQMMYVADTRIQMLLSYVFAGDERLARRGMELFDLSRDRGGYPMMRHPSRERQESATFAMIWPWMLHDFALWRGDGAFLRQRLPGLRALMEALAIEEDETGLLAKPPGWLFIDWVMAWFAGWAPGQREGRRSALINLQYLITLQRAADLERWVGETVLADRHVARAQRLAAVIAEKFWDEPRGLWANDDAHDSFSQHAQALAVLAGMKVPDVSRWADATANGLAGATIYFQHYLFEALGRIGRADLVLERFDMWRWLVTQGFKTPMEHPEPSRSDCHAWGAHPVFHLHATVAGIRPASPGFRTVRIAPQPGALRELESRLPHPRGFVRLKATFEGERISAVVELPPETSGVFVWRGQEIPLRSGKQDVRLGG